MREALRKRWIHATAVHGVGREASFRLMYQSVELARRCIQCPPSAALAASAAKAKPLVKAIRVKECRPCKRWRSGQGGAEARGEITLLTPYW